MTTFRKLMPKRRTALAGGALLLTLAAAVTAVHAHDRGVAMAGMGHHGGMGAPMAMMGGPGVGLPMAGPMLERMLDGVAATPEQRSQIRAIAEAAATDLRALHDRGRALRQQGLQLFAQPSVDAAAAEAQRQTMMQHADQVSRRMTQAMLDVARVLTPEQRAQLVERLGQRREMMERHRRERMQLDGAPRS